MAPPATSASQSSLSISESTNFPPPHPPQARAPKRTGDSFVQKNNDVDIKRNNSDGSDGRDASNGKENSHDSTTSSATTTTTAATLNEGGKDDKQELEEERDTKEEGDVIVMRNDHDGKEKPLIGRHGGGGGGEDDGLEENDLNDLKPEGNEERIEEEEEEKFPKRSAERSSTNRNRNRNRNRRRMSSKGQGDIETGEEDKDNEKRNVDDDDDITEEEEEEEEKGEGADLEEVQVTQREEEDEPPDGGYGWVNVFCMAAMNSVTWGMNTTFGVFLSFYQSQDYFPGATPLDYAFIGGLSISLAMLIAPLSNYLAKKYTFKFPMSLGTLLIVLSQIGAAFSKSIQALFVTQGMLFGFGLGLVFIPPFPLPSQWFKKHRGIAMGIVAAGSGIGGLSLSLITRAIIQSISLKAAFLINALIAFIILTPVVILLRWRGPPEKYSTLEIKLAFHKGFIWVIIWGFFSMLGYVLCLYSLASFMTKGLGYSQSTAANINSILAAGQLVGRPIGGRILDRWGRINMSIFLTALSGASCLFLWIFSRSLAPMIVFAFWNGATGGNFWGGAAPIAAEVVGLKNLGSALAILWLSIVLPTLFAEPVAIWLLDASSNLGRTGADQYLISIGFAGGSYMAAALALYPAKIYTQKSWKLWMKT